MKRNPMPHAPTRLASAKKGGFTLLEMMVSVAILLMLMAILAGAMALVSPVLKSSGNGATSFQQARAGFEAMTQTLSQANLNTYWDYVDSNGNPRTPSTAQSFVPAGFKRTSQLHFISGLATSAAQGTSSTLIPGGSATVTPGDAVFFQAPLGRSAIGSPYQPLDSSLNEVGFWAQFSDDAGDWPSFVTGGLGKDYRFRLMEWVPQTQNVQIFASTLQTNYNLAWVTSYLPATVGGNPPTGQDAPRILAENVVLLLLVPKLTPEDEAILAGSTPASPGTLLCPNYAYDSRAWQTGYSPGATGAVSGNFGSSTNQLASLMRNQLPPLVDVVMVAIGDSDALRLQRIHGTNLPPEVQIPSGSFQASANLAADLQTYETQLQAKHITFKVFSTTVQIKGAKWSLN